MTGTPEESLTRRFASKTPPLLEIFRPITHYRRLASGEYLFRQGDEASHLYGVTIGKLYITVGVPDTPKEAVLAVLTPGQMVGELSMIDGGTRSANARAEGSTLVAAISHEDFSQYVIERPEVALRLLTMLSRRLRMTTQRIESLALWDIPARLAKILIEFAEGDSAPYEDGCILNSPISQKTLAAMSGSTREWVNAVLRGY